MTRDEIKQREIEETFLLEDKEMVAYAVEIATMKAFLVYYFNENDLVWASSILFRNQYEDKDLYIDDFTYLKNILTQKYGAPLIDDVRWVDGIKSHESGIQVMSGNLRYSTFWFTESTMINLVLEGEDQQIILSIDYCDLEYYLDGLLKELEKRDQPEGS